MQTSRTGLVGRTAGPPGACGDGGEPDPGRRAPGRRGQAEATRAALLHTAERLYAEHGLAEVSNRQVAEAAGSANNSAVAYHVGTKDDLVAAICRAHAEPIARIAARLVDGAAGSTVVRDHISCLVRPYTDHLAELGSPSWFARFTAQAAADPVIGQVRPGDELLVPLFGNAVAAIRTLLPALPDDVAALRDRMVHLMVVHTCAEQERVAADTGVPVDWVTVGDGLTDAALGVLTAAVAPRRGR